MPEEQGFLRDIQGAAASNHTVLAPGSKRLSLRSYSRRSDARSSRRSSSGPPAAAAVSVETVAARQELLLGPRTSRQLTRTHTAAGWVR